MKQLHLKMSLDPDMPFMRGYRNVFVPIFTKMSQVTRILSRSKSIRKVGRAVKNHLQ